MLCAVDELEAAQDRGDFKLASAILAERQERAAALFDVTGAIAIREGDHESFFLLHPSTRIPGGWQVSFFDRNGPYSHTEGETREEAIERALDMRSLAHVRPVSEEEFIELQSSPSFIEGTKRVRFVQLDNQIRFEFGYGPEVLEYMHEARQARDTDEAIKILEIGLRTLRRQRR